MGVLDRLATALGIQHKPAQLSQKAVARGAQFAHALTLRPAGKADPNERLQLRFNKKGFHVVPFKDSKRRRDEHDEVRTQLQQHMKLNVNSAVYGTTEAQQTAHAISRLSSGGFTSQQLNDALAPVSSAQFAAQTRAMGRSVVQQAGDLRRNGAPLAGTDLDVDEADDFAQQTHDRLNGYHEAYERHCLPQAGDTAQHKRDKKRLKDGFRKAFKESPLTKNLKLSPQTLHQKVLEEPGERIARLSQQLEELTAAPAPDTPTGQRERAEQVQRCGTALKQAIADWSELLAVVGVGLTQLAFDQDGPKNRALIQLAAGLIAQGQAVQLPAGYHMAEYRKATDILDSLALRDTAEQVIESIRAQLHRALRPLDINAAAEPMPNGHPVLIDKPHAQVEQEAKAAAKAFTAMLNAYPTTGVDAAHVQEAIEDALRELPVTQALGRHGTDLVQHLFEAFPASLALQIQQTAQTVKEARGESARTNPSVQELAVSRSAAVMKLLSGYTEILATVGDALVNRVDSSAWSEEQRSCVRELGFSLVALARSRVAAGSEHRMQFFQAQQNFLEALRAVAALQKSKPAPTEPLSPPVAPPEDRSQIQIEFESESESKSLGPSRTPSQTSSQGPSRRGSQELSTSTEQMVAEPPAELAPPQVEQQAPVVHDAPADPLSGVPKLPLRKPDPRVGARRRNRTLGTSGSTAQVSSPRRSAPPSSLPPFEKPENLPASRTRSVQQPVRKADPRSKSVQFAEAPELLSEKTKTAPKTSRPPRRPETALADFVQEVFTPRGDAALLDEEQRSVEAWFKQALKKLFPTRSLDLSLLAPHLDGMLVDIRAAQVQLQTLEQQQAPAEQRLKLADELQMRVDAYVAQHGTVVRLLEQGSEAVDMPKAWRTELKQVARAMKRHARALSAPHGELQELRAWARKVEVDELGRLTPQPAVQRAQPSVVDSPLSPRRGLDKYLNGMEVHQPSSDVVKRGMLEEQTPEEALQQLLNDLNKELAGKKQ